MRRAGVGRNPGAVPALMLALAARVLGGGEAAGRETVAAIGEGVPAEAALGAAWWPRWGGDACAAGARDVVVCWLEVTRFGGARPIGAANLTGCRGCPPRCAAAAAVTEREYRGIARVDPDGTLTPAPGAALGRALYVVYERREETAATPAPPTGASSGSFRAPAVVGGACLGILAALFGRYLLSVARRRRAQAGWALGSRV
ncbi:envelope glycoprotein J [Ateline alphaherpesvirus 1]|uniref:Envelope glycoprotein J n=1 Tax=Herpesvirus ateles type 1 (strain Lennette) TaxID=35243 RepID=A0A1S6JLR9_HSVA1|nr:envelope glycoprotein J [Ateline alphaherpesvirus 1]AQS79222.1 envelope glycoprotein J [Ateline alphaherpesvirus 1]